MTNFTYSTELSIQGPWLLSRSALEELDKILERTWLEFQQRKQKKIDEAVAQMVAARKNTSVPPTESDLAFYRRQADSYEHRCKRSAVVHFSLTKSLQAETIREAIGQLVASDEYPKGFSVSLSIGHVDASVSVGQATYASDLLQVRVSPETTSTSRELFGALRQWAETNQPPAWQRAWARVGGFLWFPWVLTLLTILSSLPSQERAAQEVARQSAESLLQGGIEPSEMPAAIELMLRVATDQITTPSTPMVPRWFWLFFWAGLVSMLALQFRPRAVILGGHLKSGH